MVGGRGFIEVFAWETEPGFAVHVLNYTNVNVHRGWVREFYPIGEQKVSMRLPEGRRIKRVECCAPEGTLVLTPPEAWSSSLFPPSMTRKSRHSMHSRFRW